MARVYVSSAALNAADSFGSTNRVYVSSAKLTAISGTGRVYVSSAALKTVSFNGPPVTPISDVRIEPLTSASVTGTLIGGGSADSWSFVQTGGPAVTMSGTGNSRTFFAPPTIEGTTVLIEVTATVDGDQSDPVTARFLVYPQQTWRLTDTGWVAYKSTRIP